VERTSHPGIAEQVHPGRRRLADPPPLPLTSIAPVVAALAATVADLHAMGVVHGAIRTERVVLEPDGRPVLCGPFSSNAANEAGRAADVHALGELLRGLVARAPVSGNGDVRRQLLALALRAANCREGEGPTAVELGGSIGAVAQRPAPAPGRRVALRLVIVAIAVTLTLVGIGALETGKGQTATPSPRSPEPFPTLADGVITDGATRWSVAGSVESVVRGDWDCDGHRTFALLDRDAGDVYRSDAWPMAAVLTVPLVAEVDGALALRVIPRRAGRCDELAVVRDGRNEVVVP
jgi:hypothetical protein